MSKLLFLGDFFYDYDTISKDREEIAKWINENEYSVILNLEGSLSNKGKKIKKRGPNLSHSPITIKVLKKLNVVGVCLANNHMLDYGEGGLKETLDLLEDNHIPHTGAGMNLTEALQPMAIEVGGQKIIVQNFGWDVEETVYATEKSGGCAPRDEGLIIKRTRELRISDAILINIYH
jgi:poly-gamma-glutamate capsule biosynthesis protein CapA/YwtB (metallophosphatase superfamily)